MKRYDPDDYFSHERELKERYIDGMFVGVCITLALFALSYVTWRLERG